jgi:hypothetical protein
MFPLHLLLSPQSSLPQTPLFPTKVPSHPTMTGFAEPLPARPAVHKERRAAWALTWLGPETAIVPPTGINIPGMGR